jgi:hypothetical protein
MPNNQIFGSASKIDPFITVEGVQYSLLLKFKSSRRSDEPPQDVVAGIIDSVISLGSGRYRVNCQRSVFMSSRTINIPGFGGYEEQWGSLCGGGVCNAPEPLRLYSWLSPNAVRGDMANSLAEDKDMLWAGPSGSEQGYFIERADPFYTAPSVLDFTPVVAPPKVIYVNLEFWNMQIPPPDRTGLNENVRIDMDLNSSNSTLYDNDADGSGRKIGVYVYGPLSAQELTRKIFENPPGNPEPAYYPSGATFAQGEYWIDPIAYEIKMSSLNNIYGPHGSVIWAERGYMELGWGDGLFSTVLEGYGEGYDLADGFDDISGVVMNTFNENLDPIELVLYKGNTNNYGTGSMEWAFLDEGLKIVLLFSGGYLTGLYARTAPDSSLEIVNESSPFPFEMNTSGPDQFVRFTRAGSVVTVEAKQGASWISLGSYDFGPDLTSNTAGQIGFRAWDGNHIIFSPLPTKMYKVGNENGDMIAKRQVIFQNLMFFKDYFFGSSSSIVSAYSMIDLENYSGAGDPRRNKAYFSIPVPGYYRFYCETAPDVVRFQLNETVPALSPPGRAPRVTSGILNFATVANQDTGLATNNPYQNRANFLDSLLVRTHNGVFPYGPGDAFTIRRNAVLDPTQSWELQYDLRNGESDWVAMDENDFLARPAEGVFIIRKSWIDSLPIDSKPCFRLIGTFITHHANLDSRTINELVSSLEAMENNLFTIDGVSGVGNGIAGWMAARTMNITQYACGSGCLGIATGLEMGTLRNWWGPWSTVLEFGELSLPQPWTDPSTGKPGTCIIDQSGMNAESYSNNDNSQVYAHCPTPESPCGPAYINGDKSTTSMPVIIWPWIEGINYAPPSIYTANVDNYFGTDIETNFVLMGDLAPTATYFKFSGIGFELPRKLKRAINGTQVVEAYVEVLFNGVQRRNWQIRRRGRVGRIDGMMSDGSYYHLEAWINGTKVVETKGSNVLGGPMSYVFPPEDLHLLTETTSNISFDLIGRRRNSKRVFFEMNYESQRRIIPPEDFDPDYWREVFTLPVPESKFRSFASGIAGSSQIRSGRWSLVDCRLALQAAISAKSSEYVDFQLFPVNGSSMLNASTDTLKNYTMGLAPSINLETEIVDTDWFSYDLDMSGQFTSFSNVQVGNIMMKIRFPNGALEDFKIPHLPRSKMTP